MTLVESTICVVAVTISSASQLCMKSASSSMHSVRGWILVAVGGLLMLFSMLAAVWILRTVQLSQLVAFASIAYVLVPLGGKFLFGEKLHTYFGVGVLAIISGILLIVI